MTETATTGQSTYKALFIDDRFVEQTIGLRRNFHQAKRHGDAPILKADRPWEADAAFVDSGMVIYDEDEKLFKAWYQGGACWGPDDGSNMCFATSTDGTNWDKSALGLIEFEGSKDNNIVLRATGMMHDPDLCSKGKFYHSPRSALLIKTDTHPSYLQGRRE